MNMPNMSASAIIVKVLSMSYTIHSVSLCKRVTLQMGTFGGKAH